MTATVPMKSPRMDSTVFVKYQNLHVAPVHDDDSSRIQNDRFEVTRNSKLASSPQGSHDDMSTLSYLSHDTGSSWGTSTPIKDNYRNVLPHHYPSIKNSSSSQASTCTASVSVSTSSGMSRSITRSSSRSVFSDAEMSHAQTHPTYYGFGQDVNNLTRGDPCEPIFRASLRNCIEPHIAKARKAREERRHIVLDKIGIDPRTIESISITSNAFVPYPALRQERPFLFDTECYPLHLILADTLGVSDLSRLHEHNIKDKQKLLSPLLDAKKRNAFHRCYDNFVKNFCIPLIHSIAITQKMVNEFSRNEESQKIRYRYQAFPCIRVIPPNELSLGPHCDMSSGHSMGNINFHIPLTPAFGTNCVYTESHPGREDWHPLKTKAVGLGYIFDAARCLNFTLENMTESTCVSLDFRIAVYRDRSCRIPRNVSNAHMMIHNVNLSNTEQTIEEEDCDVNDILCNQKMLKDKYSTLDGYYEDAYINVGMQAFRGVLPGPIVHKKNRGLMRPDKRVASFSL